jgi:hypothetical protein
MFGHEMEATAEGAPADGRDEPCPSLFAASFASVAPAAATPASSWRCRFRRAPDARVEHTLDEVLRQLRDDERSDVEVTDVVERRVRVEVDGTDD